MCEASVYIQRPDGSQELVMEDVDLVELDEGGTMHLVSVFGAQRLLRASIRSMSLASHRILVEKI